jgi:putative radical SAM enzyme (TIGR03279 family)
VMAMNVESSVRTRNLSLPMADENSVVRRAKADRARILKVDAESAAEEAGILPGDVVTHVNGSAVLDIVDWAFLTAGEQVLLEVDRPEVGSVHFQIEKGYDEDLGIEFGDDLFDRVHICKNKCVFCFLYQQPKGLRPSLYIKDDDYRLSFLHGNYLTLTNMGEDEFQRVIDQKLSPLFVSVHATDPEVRGRMLGRKGPEPILPRLQMLADAKIQIHGQVVLCPGYNDGEQLAQTVRELGQLHPDARETYGGVLSVAVVPVGLTQFRDRLAALKTCDGDFDRALVAEAETWRNRYRETLGTNFVFLSDEFYLNAGLSVPPARQYEGFPQLEDGVGLVRMFLDDIKKVAKHLPRQVKTPRTATLVTGELAGPLLQQLADTLNQVGGVDVNVCAVHNTFFQGNISVAGLLTGRDIADALHGMGDALGERIVVPSIMLRDPDRDIFLDDMTLEQFESAVGRPVCIVERMPSAAARAVLN